MLLDDIATFLAPSNSNQTVYKASMPDSPDDTMCIYEYGGTRPSLTHFGIAYRNPSIQVSVRSKSYQTARTKIEAAYTALAALINTQVGGTMVLKATPVQDPFNLGPVDSQERVRLICNFDLSIQ